MRFFCQFSISFVFVKRLLWDFWRSVEMCHFAVWQLWLLLVFGAGNAVFGAKMALVTRRHTIHDNGLRVVVRRSPLSRDISFVLIPTNSECILFIMNLSQGTIKEGREWLTASPACSLNDNVGYAVNVRIPNTMMQTNPRVDESWNWWIVPIWGQQEHKSEKKYFVLRNRVELQVVYPLNPRTDIE